ncbi:transporter of mugineic acid2 isoform X4 [Zea mays]|uniref:Major facilitator superfamily (MFS) profile domain-containing protein n=1 Tax=Zea mays TaxID=4577 RepID=A0A804NYP7_MAIZE|nr:transporter of mugineic acid2 isoform X4 [Zea mays]|eukprot:XP_023157998.1 uncharacterized protein LOC541978 isoform X2 [Zea mays]
MEEAAPAGTNKVYYDGCPGCAMDRRKESRAGVPYKELLFVAAATFASALPITSLFPFLYFMIRDLRVAEREEDIGFYAGFLGAAYMIGRGVASVFWGVVADRVGRKPVIAFSVLSVVVFNTLFGLSAKYWMAIATRFLLGALNGFLAPAKAYSIEVCRPEQQALGISVVSTAWGMGVIIGPAIGGYLAQPAKQYPHLFHEKSVFGRFPYLLPCLCISFFAALVVISCAWLPETLHKHRGLERAAAEVAEGTTAAAAAQESTPEPEPEPPKSSLLRNRPLMSSIVTYCVFSLHDTAYVERSRRPQLRVQGRRPSPHRRWRQSPGVPNLRLPLGQQDPRPSQLNPSFVGAIHTDNRRLPLHDALVGNKAWCASLRRGDAQKRPRHHQSHRHIAPAEQRCATGAEGRCERDSYDGDVSVQGVRSGRGRHLVLVGTEAPACRVLSR